MYEVATKETAKWSFQIPPEVPAADQVKETWDCEAVVVGAGLAGLSAACKLKELGVDVLLLEKSDCYQGRGGHFGVPQSSLMEEAGIHNDLQEIVRQWIVMSGNNVDEDLIWLFMRRSGEAMDWFIPKAKEDGLNIGLVNCTYPVAPYKEFLGAHFFKARGNFVSKALYASCIKHGVRVAFETPAQQLIKDKDGKIVGLYAKNKDGDIIKVNAPLGVVIATGDIGGDEEMCRAYAPDALRTLASQYVPVGCNTGDGHKMGLWAGATFAEEVFPLMMHPQHYAWTNLAFLFVNQKGKRFMNEDSYIQGRATQIMRQPDGVAYSIIASDYNEHMKYIMNFGGGILWGNAGLPYGKEWDESAPPRDVQRALDTGMAYKADTLEELAEMINVPVETFVKTVNRFNENCHEGYDKDYGKRKELMIPIEKGPFIAIKIGVALLEVVGGLSINTSMEVLDKNRQPIEGLYGAGDCTGGMYGHEYVTTILGNSHGRALTWGYIAAETIAAKKAGTFVRPE